MTDVIDTALSLAPGDLIHDLRRQRPDVVEQLQRAHDLLFLVADDAAPSRAERVAAAYRTALSAGSAALGSHYRDLLDDPVIANAVERGEFGDERGDAIVRHAETLTSRPKELTQDHLLHLQDVGLTVAEIVTLSQLISFVNFQIRVAAGLDAMKG